MGEGVHPIDNFQFIEPGLYNIRQIIDIITLNNAAWLEMSIDEKSGDFSLHIKHKKYKFKFSSELANLLGLPSDLLSLGMHNGHFDLQPLKKKIFIAIKSRLANIFAMVNLVVF